MTADEAFASTHWTTVHRWDFEGNLTDSVGGATVSPLDRSYFSEPTYANGKIVLNGYQAYTFDEMLTFDQYEGTSGMRIDILARMDFNTAAHTARRVFGCNVEGSRTAGLTYINIPGSEYGGCSFALSTVSPAFGSFVIIPDQSKVNVAEENFYTFIYYNNMLYHYSDGVLIGMKENGQGGAFTFTDFLGCSYIGEDMNYNFVGEIDFIQISLFDPTAENEAITVPEETEPSVTTTPEASDTEPSETTPEESESLSESSDTKADSSDTASVTTGEDNSGDKEKGNGWVIPVVIVAAVVVVVAVVIAVVKKKKK